MQVATCVHPRGGAYVHRRSSQQNSQLRVKMSCYLSIHQQLCIAQQVNLLQQYQHNYEPLQHPTTPYIHTIVIYTALLHTLSFTSKHTSTLVQRHPSMLLQLGTGTPCPETDEQDEPTRRNLAAFCYTGSARVNCSTTHQP